MRSVLGLDASGANPRAESRVGLSGVLPVAERASFGKEQPAVLERGHLELQLGEANASPRFDPEDLRRRTGNDGTEDLGRIAEVVEVLRVELGADLQQTNRQQLVQRRSEM